VQGPAHFTVGGVDARDVPIAELRAAVAIVTQRPILFSILLKDNLTAARPDVPWDEVLAACEAAGVDEFANELPNGYDTLIGEKGIALSGGQRQRLAIARAILRDAPILILDEATSSLDTEVERIVQSALEELMQGRTTSCIAHRLSTIQNADVIVVMDQGRIVETGKHDQLLQRNGIYRKLYEMQFQSDD